MSIKEKVLIYPFDIESSPLLRHKELLNNYEIKELVSLNGWNFDNTDSSNVDGGIKTNIKIGYEFNKALKNCDTVVFTKPFFEIQFHEIIYPQVIEAINNKKNIISFINMDNKIKKNIIKLCKNQGVYFKDYSSLNLNNNNKYEFKKEILYKINTPIIFVVGVTERVSKFEIQLNLREKIMNMGYKVSQIGSRNYCEFIGFNSFPEFMYNKQYSEQEKIILFNHFVRQIEVEQNPDVIIIGIPGGAIKINDYMNNNFGIFAYEVSQAVEPDAVILSTLYDEFELDHFQQLNNLSKYRFGFNVDCYNLANAKFDWETSREIYKESYITLNTNFIDEKKEKYKDLEKPVFNVFNINDSENMASYLINTLQQYGEYQII